MEEYKKSYIITEIQKNVILAWGDGTPLDEYIPGKNRNMEHVFFVDERIGTGNIYSESLWLMPDSMVDPEIKKKRGEMMATRSKNMDPEDIPGPKPHTHPFDEVFTFFGSDFENPEDLCGEVEFYLEDEPVKVTKSSLFFIPAGMKHSPLNANRLDRPVFHFSMGFTDSYYHDILNKKPGAYAGQNGLSRYCISGDRAEGLRLPSYRSHIPEGYVHNVTQINSDILPESNVHCEACWICPEDKTGIREDVTFADQHSHPFQQIIAFYGSDSDNIYDLHGEVELWVQGKPYKMNKSFFAVIPEGIEHGPLTVRNVKKPVFHYTIGNAKKYI